MNKNRHEAASENALTSKTPMTVAQRSPAEACMLADKADDHAGRRSEVLLPKLFFIKFRMKYPNNVST